MCENCNYHFLSQSHEKGINIRDSVRFDFPLREICSPEPSALPIFRYFIVPKLYMALTFQQIPAKKPNSAFTNGCTTNPPLPATAMLPSAFIPAGTPVNTIAGYPPTPNV